MRKIALLLVVLVAISCESSHNDVSTKEIIVCGREQVIILTVRGEEGSIPEKTWNWSAKNRDDLPAAFREKFNTTDECKPFDQGRRILVTSSGGAVAMIDREQDRVLFYAKAANAHSADLLPNNRVAVAASHATDGDRLIVFDLDKPDSVLLSADLPWGHGVVWDGKRKRLWALSGSDIRVYGLKNWDSRNPALERLGLIPLPEDDGHDLYPVGDSPFLSVSTGEHCWLFDRDTQKFTPHPLLYDKVKVKSICQHPVTRQLVYVKAKGGKQWWSEKVLFLQPEDTLQIPGEQFYKARWNVRIQ